MFCLIIFTCFRIRECNVQIFLYFFNNVSGIDISPEQIKIAKGLGITNVVQADIIDFLRDKKDSYDVAIARNILEHFTKDEIGDVLTIIYHVLRKGGVVILQGPNAESPFGSRGRYADFTHEIAFTSSSLSQLLKTFGFVNIKFNSTPPVIFGVKSLIRFVLWKTIETICRFVLLVEVGSTRGIVTQDIVAAARK